MTIDDIDFVFPNIFIDKLISDTRRDSNFLNFENITFIEICMSDSESLFLVNNMDCTATGTD